MNWQVRVLQASSGQLAAVLCSILAHNFPDDFELFLRGAYGTSLLAKPFYCSAGKIMRNGMIVADVMSRGSKLWKQPVFKDTEQMQATLRKVADILKLDDPDRIALFDCARKWIVADWRVGPNGENLSE